MHLLAIHKSEPNAKKGSSKGIFMISSCCIGAGVGSFEQIGRLPKPACYGLLLRAHGSYVALRTLKISQIHEPNSLSHRIMWVI